MGGGYGGQGTRDWPRLFDLTGPMSDVLRDLRFELESEAKVRLQKGWNQL